MRFPEQALEYGIDQLATCFDGVTASDVVKTVHLCCGYPNHLVSWYATCMAAIFTKTTIYF